MKNIRPLAFLVSALLLCASCVKQEKTETVNGEANVEIHLLGVEAEQEDDETTKESSTATRSAVGFNTTASSTTQIVPFGEDMAIVATLSRDSLQTTRKTGKTSQVGRTRADIVRTPLTTNVRYKVMVYDATGAFVSEKQYQVGQESTAGGFVLDAGKAYTFVAYSINSAGTLPDAVNKANLNTTSLNSINTQLLYFRSNITLQEGNNNLNIILKHQYSQIITRIELDPTTAGNITAIGTPVIRPVRQNANIKLSDGVITYGTAVTNGTPLSFPSLGSGVRSITSNPTLVISPATTTAELSIGNLTANGVSKTNVSLFNLNVSPGKRYNLVMRLQSPCTEVVSGGATFNLADGNSQTFTAPAADYGFTFDIHRLDNSFNLRINGTLLATRELQFESGLAALARNVQFADGTVWGANSIPQIYNMNGSAASPILRVIISASGDITLLGSKSASGGNLQPLRLTNGNAFNRIQWNTSSANTVVATQSVQGITYMTGSGYGRRIVPCR